MVLPRIYILLLLCYCFVINAQNKPELQRVKDTTLFDLADTSCLKISGEWTGEEIQYDATKSFIKVKFKVVFTLQQRGNKVWGTSHIQDKFRGSYGIMKVRGIVTGDKLYFEEYELVDEKWYKAGYVWCLRSGELSYSLENENLVLTGLDYHGYASDTYRQCTDYTSMVLHQPASAGLTGVSQKNSLLHKSEETLPVTVYPNPVMDACDISFNLTGGANVLIELFSLTGAHIATVCNKHFESGEQLLNFHFGQQAQGIYLLRACIGNTVVTKRIVKAK